MVIGLKCPRLDPSNQTVRQENIRLTREFLDKFAQRRGSIQCKDLLGLDLNDPVQAEQAKQTGLFGSVCAQPVRDAAQILGEIFETKETPHEQ